MREGFWLSDEAWAAIAPLLPIKCLLVSNSSRSGGAFLNLLVAHHRLRYRRQIEASLGWSSECLDVGT